MNNDKTTKKGVCRRLGREETKRKTTKKMVR